MVESLGLEMVADSFCQREKASYSRMEVRLSCSREFGPPTWGIYGVLALIISCIAWFVLSSLAFLTPSISLRLSSSTLMQPSDTIQWLLMDGFNSAVLARPINNRHHIRHCFDYIRQVLLCVSDVALEGRDPDGEKEDAAIHGIGAKRVCKDPREVFEWAEERRTSEAGDLVGGT